MPIRKSQIKAITKYEHNHYDKICIRLPKGTREKVKDMADKAGESMNEYIVNALKARMGDIEVEVNA